MTSPRLRFGAAALGAGLILATPATALAGPRDRQSVRTSTEPGTGTDRAGRSLETVRARCLEAITKRQTALTAASERLETVGALTDEHEADLLAIIADTDASLESLSAEIAAAADPASLKGDCTAILEGHRVFALILPRTRLVAGSDVAVAAAGRLTGMADRLATAIDRAEAAGTDVAGARADLAAMRAAIGSGEQTAAGIPGPIMDLTPADWNADHEVLTPARSDLRSARGDLKEARTLGARIVASLKGSSPPAV